MRTYPVFCNSEYHGRIDLPAYYQSLKEFEQVTRKLQEKQPKPHRIYGYKTYNPNGGIEALYLVYSCDEIDNDFDRIARLSNHLIYAIHLMK